MTYGLLFIIAMFSGIVGALVGLGGGAILIPATLFIGVNLGYIAEITPQTVVGLSVIMMIFTGLSATLTNVKSGTVDFKSAWIFFIGSVPGTITGVWINKSLNLPSFQLYFGLFLIVIALILLLRDYMKPIRWFVDNGRKRYFTDAQGKSYEYGYPVWFAISFCFFVGLISGLFGVGGGSLIVPAMVILFLFPPHVAVATSMFLVFLTAIISSASHIYLGNVPWAYTIPVIIGAYLGAKIGANTTKKINSRTITGALRIVLLLLGVRSVLDGIF